MCFGCNPPNTEMSVNDDPSDPNSKLKRNKWMNKRPQGRVQYNPTLLEHYANVITHGVLILPACLGALYLNFHSKTSAQSFAFFVYSVSLILVFTVSTTYHFFSLINNAKFQAYKTFFHYCDRATIYVFIASSYTPWLYLRSTRQSYGETMFWIVWIGALLGIAYQIVFHEKYKLLEITFYLIIGVCPSIVILDMHDVRGLDEVAIGGAMYVTGVLFFKSDGIIPFAHAIWHLFVCGGACFHYYAILNYLIV